MVVGSGGVVVRNVVGVVVVGFRLWLDWCGNDGGLVDCVVRNVGILLYNAGDYHYYYY